MRELTGLTVGLSVGSFVGDPVQGPGEVKVRPTSVVAPNESVATS